MTTHVILVFVLLLCDLICFFIFSEIIVCLLIQSPSGTSVNLIKFNFKTIVIRVLKQNNRILKVSLLLIKHPLRPHRLWYKLLKVVKAER